MTDYHTALLFTRILQRIHDNTNTHFQKVEIEAFKDWLISLSDDGLEALMAPMDMYFNGSDDGRIVIRVFKELIADETHEMDLRVSINEYYDRLYKSK